MFLDTSETYKLDAIDMTGKGNDKATANLD